MDAGQDTATRLERCFAEIGETRMEGVPILNPALRVKARGLREWQSFWLTALITPWFLNLMLLPRQEGADDDATALPVGAKRFFAFPAGSFEFIRGREAALGGYWMCSLFSPVLEFTDQAAAEATADAALQELFTADEEETDAEMATIWRGELPLADSVEPDPEDAPEDRPAPSPVSRRAFLRGPAAREEGQL